MSAFLHIQDTAGTAIQELESEITGLEAQIEAHKLRIQNARVQIQALKCFLSPEENGEVKTTRTKKNGKTQANAVEDQQCIVQ